MFDTQGYFLTLANAKKKNNVQEYHEPYNKIDNIFSYPLFKT